MSSIIEFPIADKPITESEIDKLHGDAFRELIETNLRDCVRMSGIAAELMLNAKIEDDSLRFAVFHTAEMLMSLEKEYDASWHGDGRKDAWVHRGRSGEGTGANGACDRGHGEETAPRWIAWREHHGVVDCRRVCGWRAKHAVSLDHGF